MSPEFMDFVIFIFGLGLSAFFSGSESAIMSIPAKRLRQLMEESVKNKSAYMFLAEKPSELLTTILIGNNFVNIFVASFATTMAQNYFENDALSYSVGITTIFILIFGEIIPKTFVRNHSEKLVVPIVRILQAIYWAMFPIVKIFMSIIKLVLGGHASLQERMVTKDDIEFMVGEAEKDKTIDSKQIDLLTSILEFPTIKVKDIMTPRHSIKAIQVDMKFDDVVNLIQDVQHSRYPVYEDDLDNCIGFVHVRDIIFSTYKEASNFNIRKHINPAFYVYEHMKIQSVFDHMNRNKVHLALVKDENGLLVGIITLEDIMEEIFGEIQDEHDDESDLIAKEAHETLAKGLSIDASINLRDLYNEYDIKIPLNDNYSTLRGFLYHILGDDFPEEGNLLLWEGLSFEILKVEDNEIQDVKIEIVDSEKFDMAQEKNLEGQSESVVN